MTGTGFRILFHGTRGSLPVSGPGYRQYGGNTISIEMHCGDQVLLFDAGSGLPPAAKRLLAAGRREFNLFFSHCHFDHIIGLPYFLPLYDADCAVTFWSGHLAGRMTTEQMIRDFVRPPWFPVALDVCSARIACRDFRAGDVLAPLPGIDLRTGSLNHPGGAIGYRVEWGGRVVAMITDTEHQPGTLDPEVLALIERADLVLYDASYTDAEMERWRGFGHSSWQQGLRLAREAGVGRIAFIHHAPWRGDDELAEIDRLAQAEFPGAFCARDGQVVDL